MKRKKFDSAKFRMEWLNMIEKSNTSLEEKYRMITDTIRYGCGYDVPYNWFTESVKTSIDIYNSRRAKYNYSNQDTKYNRNEVDDTKDATEDRKNPLKRLFSRKK